jgi:hypothetical protein
MRRIQFEKKVRPKMSRTWISPTHSRQSTYVSAAKMKCLETDTPVSTFFVCNVITKQCLSTSFSSRRASSASHPLKGNSPVGSGRFCRCFMTQLCQSNQSRPSKCTIHIEKMHNAKHFWDQQGDTRLTMWTSGQVFCLTHLTFTGASWVQKILLGSFGVMGAHRSLQFFQG